MKKLSLSILAVLLSVCLLFALSVQCAAAEVMGNNGIGASENSGGTNSAGDLNNGFIEGNPNNPNDGNNGSGFTSDNTNESGNANGSYNGGVNGDSTDDNGAANGVNNGANESAAAQGETSAAVDGNTETSSGFSWVMLLVWLVIIAAVILLIIALIPKRRNG